MPKTTMITLIFVASLTPWARDDAPNAAVPPAETPITIGSSHLLESNVLAQARRINVYLPPGYRKGDQHYPVLFLLDGGLKEDYLHIAGIATLAADWRKIREFIVVGIKGIEFSGDPLAGLALRLLPFEVPVEAFDKGNLCR